MVSAWSTANHRVLGQRKVDAKSNEIKAIQALLETLDIRGATVAPDALGCQKEIANQIINQGGDYILALKGNQGTLHDDIKLFFEDAAQTGYGDVTPQTWETVEKDHGRIETRRCTVVQDVDWLVQKKGWKKLSCVIQIRSKREIKDVVSEEERYYIASGRLSAEEALVGIRAHWGIENS